MMKFIYIASIPVLIVLIAIYAVMLLSYHPPVIDKNVTGLTDNLIKNSPALNVQELASYKDPLRDTMPSDIWKSSLFDPDRGITMGISGSVDGLKNVELIGVFNSGNVKGAVILIKTGGSSAGGHSSAYGGHSGSSGYAGYGSPTPQKPQDYVPPKTVFKVGDRLPNGLILDSVGSGSVMLRGGKELVELKMAFSSDDSLKRTAEISKLAVKPPVTIISGTQGGTAAGSRPGQPGASSPLTITPGGSGGSGFQSHGVFQGYGH